MEKGALVAPFSLPVHTGLSRQLWRSVSVRLSCAGSTRSPGEAGMATITIEATDKSGSFNALVQAPQKKPAGAVVLIQEICGVNEAMRATAKQVADLGFFAVCPDLFWRLEPGIDITDKTEAEWK